MALAGDNPSDKAEFPPLLEPGLHPVSLQKLREICVDDFPLSSTQKRSMEGLETVVKKLNENGVVGELWVDGSFLTKKIDPEDVDIVLRVDGETYENGSPELVAAIDWLNEDLKDELNVDSYYFMYYSESHPEYEFGEHLHDYWLKQWGFSRGEEMKGIAVIELMGVTQ